MTRTACFSSRSSFAASKPLTSSITLQRGVESFLTTPMLLVSRRCYELAQPWMYVRKLNFQCSPSGVTQFLLDHYAIPMSRMTLHCTFPGSDGQIVSRGREWRGADGVLAA